MSFTELVLDAGLRLAARASGPEDGRRVLALHGWLDNAGSFDLLAPLLPEHRVVALDLPGHGRSEHRGPGASYHFIDWPLDVGAAAAALGWQRFSLIGHSLGAGIAALLASVWPDRIERLVLLDGLGPATTPPADAPARLAASLRERLAPGPAVSGANVRVHASFEQAVDRLRKVNPTLPPPALQALVARGTARVADGYAFTADPRLRGTSPLRLTEAHLRAFLAQIACPVLLVRPAQGFPIDAPVLAEMTGAMRDFRMVQVPGGHHAHLDEAEAVAAVVRDFLAA
jgi:pimeloyl-ACP methyl ester carboxylesterase